MLAEKPLEVLRKYPWVIPHTFHYITHSVIVRQEWNLAEPAKLSSGHYNVAGRGSKGICPVSDYIVNRSLTS
jgi:hypothetical protein